MQKPTVVIKLVTKLPCGAWADNERGACEKPALVAFATPGRRSGAWDITPICKDCATATHAVYAAGLPIGEELRAAYQDGAS